MILTITELLVVPGAEAEFLIAVDKALPELLAAAGCHSARLVRCTSAPQRFVLLSEWATLESHTEDFYRSEAFLRWRDAVSEHLCEPPRVEHAEDLTGLITR
ncbi:MULTISPECIES: antibiotic biosynthesis monooxygenase family protein [unclassified Crossiella]|uniref:antibiotic biosynthesis monooxygenase family protein n=1 Tax=unclassified Crossiella TaxID=2620835 RepID=UPI001FFFEA73|nr:MULTISPECIES: antibiotic biosynthesis monooxygenase family protein [unclassified Crossiella]MCK2239679.1 antibiotic biosynthesis monooxygenase [Crossiella sp. S99.2]MCK2252374.1 antibiotic biosynthesis monooxygenase [Crossiella sp. S99.1]